MFCAKCGHRNADEASFCSGCGLSLAAGPGGAASTARLTSLERPGVVTLLAVLSFIVGAGLLVAAIIVALALGGEPDVPPALPFIIAGVLGLFGLLKVVAGVGLWKLRPWGRTLQIGFSCLGLLNVPMGTVISGLILYYLFRPGVKALFSGKPASAFTVAESQAVREMNQTNIAVVVVAGVVAFFVIVSIIGIIAAIAIPNLLNAIQRGKQKRTMSDLRSIAVAVETYREEHGGLPPRVPSGPDAAQALIEHLQPTYIKTLPLTDAWKHPFAWEYGETSGEDGAVVASYSIVSFGKDGQPDAEMTGGATTLFNADIVISDGEFTQYPEGTQR